MTHALHPIEIQNRRRTRPGRMLMLVGFLGISAIVLGQTTQPADTQPQPSPSGVQSDQPREAPAAAVTASDKSAPAQPTAKATAPAAPTPATSTPDMATPPSGSPQARYGLWVLLPAVVAILLAIIVRQVVPALIVGIFVGAYMIVPCLESTDAYAGIGSLLAGFRIATERYIFGVLVDPGEGRNRLMIIVFTLVIGFTVGVIGRNGGTEGMVRVVAGKSSSPRRGGITAWLAGMVVFFDDYANTMIIGPTMQPVFDRLKLSRAKLAYIVDSTAAPVASIAIIGTWIGAEIGFIQQGMDKVGAIAPDFMRDASGNVVTSMTAFLYSIPYRFYPLLALWFVFLVAFSGRDFGPMKRSERRTLSRIDPDPSPTPAAKEKPRAAKPRWLLGFIPILGLVAVTITVLIASGAGSEAITDMQAALADGGASVWSTMSWWERAGEILSKGDSYLSIFQGAMVAAFCAIILTIIARACSLRDAFDAGADGMARMYPAITILVLAWALSTILQDLKVGEVVAGHLDAMKFPARWLPFATFVAAAVISFATGTSWGTMGILCPITVEIAARLLAESGIETAEASTLFYAAVGSVLSGAVFGDHCSPISDTTVLSSLASGCPHEEHVWTQMPYALITAVAAMGLGDVLSSAYNFPWYLGLLAGAAFLAAFLYLVGRKPVASFELADA